MSARERTRRALTVVFSTVWLPATVDMPSSSTLGLWPASIIAIASSCPVSRWSVVTLTNLYHLVPMVCGYMGACTRTRVAVEPNLGPLHRRQQLGVFVCLFCVSLSFIFEKEEKRKGNAEARGQN
jgi:hypothetical protein